MNSEHKIQLFENVREEIEKRYRTIIEAQGVASGEDEKNANYNEGAVAASRFNAAQMNPRVRQLSEDLANIQSYTGKEKIETLEMGALVLFENGGAKFNGVYLLPIRSCIPMTVDGVTIVARNFVGFDNNLRGKPVKGVKTTYIKNNVVIEDIL